MKQAKGPEFIRFFKPILKLLLESGGSGTPAEIVDRSIEIANISEAEQEAVNKNGQSRIKNQVHWARQYLVWDGYLDSSKRGIWSLTEKGKSVDIRNLNPLELFKNVQNNRAKIKLPTSAEVSSTEGAITDGMEIQDHRTRLLELIRSLTPNGFERLSQRLLRESGFQHVTVTGKTGDGGIDGIGILQVNPFVSFNVLFQCKRYQRTVTPSHVRDFRGAMMGRADKGIIITTGTFTLEAKKEARRDGVPAIELVDGDALVDMFERLEIGLIPKQIYDIDQRFFDEYRK
ncbi:MAG: restriction endonuclease [Nitrospirales bacterium]|nr:restriction endonuclease [Nitrospirales bacterium]